MCTVYCGLSTLTVALVFYSWRDYQVRVLEQQRLLRDRVAYLLWTIANGAPE